MTLIKLKESPDEVMEKIVDIAKKQFKNHLLLVGAKGSLARNQFTPYSDFDLVIVVDSDKNNRWHEFMYNTTYIDAQVISLKNVLKIISNVDFSWPAQAGGKVNLKVYYDKNDTFKKVQDESIKIVKNKKLFENAISLNTIMEYFSKSERYFNSKNYTDLRWTCGGLFEEFSMILALLNQRIFTIQGPTAKISQISTFEYLPTGWKQISEDLISKSSKKNIDGARNLMSLLEKLSKKHDFKNYQIKSITDISFK